MSDLKKPPGVPEDATWSAAESAWSLGERKDGVSVGPWTWWRPDGALMARCEFDEAGRIHGLHERFHPPGLATTVGDTSAGELASLSSYEHGKLHGKQILTRPPRGSPENKDFPLANLSLHQIELLYVEGEPAGGITLYTRAGARAPVPVGVDGRSNDLGKHLAKILPGTSLALVADFVHPTLGEPLAFPRSTAISYHGPALGRTASSSPIHRMRFVRPGCPEETLMIETSEISRAFALAVDLGVARLARGEQPAESRREPPTSANKLPFKLDPAKKKLDLFNRKLKALPPAIGQLRMLEKLRLERNELVELPREVINLTHLRELDLARNVDLATLPPELFALTSLEKLELFQTALSDLSPSIGNLHRLTYLGLSETKITTLPPEIGRLAALEELELMGVPITSLPPELGKLTKLKKLNLAYTQLADLPRAVGKLASLEDLAVSSPTLTRLPTDLWRLRNLRSLALSGCELEDLSPDIGRLTSLKALFLSCGHVRRMPDTIWSLHGLHQLVLFGSPLTSIPSAVGELVHLRSLALYNTPIREVSPAIARLEKLAELTITGHALDPTKRKALKALFEGRGTRTDNRLPRCVISFHKK
jgi:Leucine-rich repeat (LRR) protein